MQKEVPDKIKVAKDRAESGNSDTLVISFETAEEVLTPRRKELLNVIESNDIESVSHLADLVDRDKGRVSKDLKELYKTDIIEIESEGSSKVPTLKHDVIDIEPIVLRS